MINIGAVWKKFNNMISPPDDIRVETKQ